MSVGDIQVEDLVPDIGDSEGPQPKDVAARIVAHIGHRIPGVKKLEKRFEGKELKSGVWSDLTALGAQLYARNKAQIDHAAEEALTDGFGKLTQKMSQPIGGDGVVIDFGEVGPEENSNNGGME